MSESADFTKLDDPEFLAARRRVRDALESAPGERGKPRADGPL